MDNELNKLRRRSGLPLMENTGDVMDLKSFEALGATVRRLQEAQTMMLMTWQNTYNSLEAKLNHLSFAEANLDDAVIAIGKTKGYGANALMQYEKYLRKVLEGLKRIIENEGGGQGQAK